MALAHARRQLYALTLITDKYADPVRCGGSHVAMVKSTWSFSTEVPGDTLRDLTTPLTFEVRLFCIFIASRMTSPRTGLPSRASAR